MDKTSIQQMVLARIDEGAEGMCFSRSDFADLGARYTLSQALSRLVHSGKLMSPIRGYYCVVRRSKFLGEVLPVDYGKLAEAMARNCGWTILPCGDVLLNELGLSTQVPVVWSYVSTGPYKRYDLDGMPVEFKHTANRELFNMSRKSAMVVQAIKTLGATAMTEEVMKKISTRLNPAERKAILTETMRTTSWIYEIVKRISMGVNDA